VNTLFRFTRFTTHKPARLSKHFKRVDNRLVQQGGGNMNEGIAERLTVSSIAEFADLLPTLSPKQALAYGVNGHEQARVVTDDQLEKARNESDQPVIARTRDHFTWPSGPGILMLDYDPPADSEPLDCAALRDALAMTCLPIGSAPAIWRPSASSCIYSSDGQELRGIAGQRLYIAVMDASDIPRAGQVLFDRLWLSGFGRYELSKSGAFLARSIIDASVFQPERLDFCGGVALGQGLAQRLPDPILFNADALFLDTRAALPDLAKEEQSRLDGLRTAMREALNPRQTDTRTLWIESRVNDRLKTIPADQLEKTRPELERAYRQAAEGGWLPPTFELTVKPKGSQAGKRITVGDLLRSKTYHEATTLDPLEPDYPEGQARYVGWLNLNARPPYLQSQAHGGTRYFLGDQAAAPSSSPDVKADKTDDDAAAEQPARFVRPATVRVVAGGLPEATDEAEAALIQHDAGIYQRGDCLCRISYKPPATVRGITWPQGAVTINPLERDAIADILNRFIGWEKWNEKQRGYKRCHAPNAIAMTLLSRKGHWQFPPLIGVISAPTLRPDGSILDQPGYDKDTGLFLDATDRFPPIPAAPSRSEGQAALQFLKDELLNRPCLNSNRPEDRGFSFVANRDRSKALAAILTGLIRHSLPTAPAFAISATRRGSAKTLLANIPALIATGRKATNLDLGNNPEETEKRIVALLITGTPMTLLDNLMVPLTGAHLCRLLTEEEYTGRYLGATRMVTNPTATLVTATGNNLRIFDDVIRRVVKCCLDPRSEYPENRQYDRNLLDWIPKNRLALVQAGLTALRAFIVAGQPQQTSSLMGTFEDWDRNIRQALIWLEEADPLEDMEDMEADDPEGKKLSALLLAWFTTFGEKKGFTSREVVARANETITDDDGAEKRTAQVLWDVLAEHFIDRRGSVRSQLVGEFIGKHKGRVEIGARFEKWGSGHNCQIWQLVIVDNDRFQKFLTDSNQGNQGNQGNRQDGQCSGYPGYPGYPNWPDKKIFDVAAEIF